VELLAQKYLERGDASCLPVPIELVSLADEQHTIEVCLLPLNAYHGALWRLGGEWIIQLKNDDTPASRRFTLFHEAFHILAHCKTAPVFRKRGTTQGSFNELLADYFAACILMPRELVKEKWAEVEDLDRMVGIFGVPRSAMCIRLKCLGFI
jgi:Predicted Zn peptidase